MRELQNEKPVNQKTRVKQISHCSLILLFPPSFMKKINMLAAMGESILLTDWSLHESHTKDNWVFESLRLSRRAAE